jgi:hypothetical protein
MKAFCFASLALALVSGCASHHSRPAKVSNADVRSPYNIPLSTPGARFGSLPAVVQATVLSEAGTASIYDIFMDTSGGRVVYKIYFEDAVNYPPLWVGSDGGVLNKDLSVAIPGPREGKASVPMSDLPTNVLRVLQDHPPGAEISNISKDYWGDHTIYVVSFKDDLKCPRMYVLADGTVLAQGPK